MNGNRLNERSMFALGEFRKSARLNGMSGLAPKADITRAGGHVR
jgi:hypothetical protein